MACTVANMTGAGLDVGNVTVCSDQPTTRGLFSLFPRLAGPSGVKAPSGVDLVRTHQTCHTRISPSVIPTCVGKKKALQGTLK